MNYKATCLIICSLVLLNVTQAKAGFEICGDFKQGELLIFKNVPEEVESLKTNGREYPVTNDGTAIVALSRDEAKSLRLVDNRGKKFVSLQVEPAVWDIQKIEGVAQSKVTPDKSHDAEILREQRDVAKSLRVMQAGNYWQKGFILPVEGRISGNFGNQRIFNGIPKSPHSGTDIAAPAGTEVKAAGDGIVVLNGKDYFYTGNMVIIDHGQGLQTIYAHLQESKVKLGDKVKQGDVIGLVGSTGRATGPHLHWGASLNNVRFRPHSLLDIKDKKCITWEKN